MKSKRMHRIPVSTFITIRSCVLLGLLALVTLLSACRSPAAGRPELTISAASSLTPAFEEIGAAFTEETDVAVTFNFASSGQLAQQIIEGAPVDVFASANVEYVVEISEAGLVVPDSATTYAYGRLTLWTQTDGEQQVDSVHDLGDPLVRSIAIANPDVAPYGRAAREALQSAGVWEVVEPKLVIGDNVRQAFQYGETGNVDIVVAPLSLSVESDGEWVLVPAALHTPIEHAVAIVATTDNEESARDFVRFLHESTGRAILERHGLEPAAGDIGL